MGWNCCTGTDSTATARSSHEFISSTASARLLRHSGPPIAPSRLSSAFLLACSNSLRNAGRSRWLQCSPVCEVCICTGRRPGIPMLSAPLSRLFTGRASRQLLPFPRSAAGSPGLRISIVDGAEGLVMNALQQARAIQLLGVRGPALRKTESRTAIQSLANERRSDRSAAHDPACSWPECVV